MTRLLEDVLTCEESDEDDLQPAEIAAWQRLLDRGVVWQLQGAFGRTATRLIERGILVRK